MKFNAFNKAYLKICGLINESEDLSQLSSSGSSQKYRIVIKDIEDLADSACYRNGIGWEMDRDEFESDLNGIVQDFENLNVKVTSGSDRNLLINLTMCGDEEAIKSLLFTRLIGRTRVEEQERYFGECTVIEQMLSNKQDLNEELQNEDLQSILEKCDANRYELTEISEQECENAGPSNARGLFLNKKYIENAVAYL